MGFESTVFLKCRNWRGDRGPYQFFIAEHTRGERTDPAGGTYTVFYDTYQRPKQYMDELGRAEKDTRCDPGRRKPHRGDGFLGSDVEQARMDLRWKLQSRGRDEQDDVAYYPRNLPHGRE